MPDNPGDPDNNDEQNFSPTEAENAAENAAAQQGVDENDDNLTAEPDPSPFGDAGEDLDPTVDAELDEALADLDIQDDIDQASVDAQVDEAAVASEAGAKADSAVDLEAQLAERTDDLKRVSAEYANFRRRTEREREATITSAKASVLTQLLPILDDLDLARQHGDLEEGALKTFADKLVSTLKGVNLEAFGEEGEAFDPEIHEAVQDLSAGDQKVVGTVLRKGYRVSDRVIRSAMVIIADPEGS